MVFLETVGILGFAYLGYTLGKQFQKLEDW